MPSTYLSLHYHIIFSTKERIPFLHPPVIDELHAYLGGTIRGLGGIPECIGGVEDHVHLLVGLKATHCLSDFMRELKKAATNWMQQQANQPDFSWQDGYAAFTVSATACEAVKKYISNQPAHHAKHTFRQELTEMLTRAGVKYDERYLD